MHRILKGLGLLGALYFCVCLSLASTVRVEGPVVFVNEVPVLRLSASSSGMSPVDRARLIANSFSHCDFLDKVVAKKSGADYVLKAGDVVLATVSVSDAHSQGIGLEQLADRWATRIRQAATLPPIKLGDTFLRLPVGVTRTISLTGPKVMDAKVETNSASTVSARITQGGLEVKGLNGGRAQIAVLYGTSMETLDVDVRPYAAQFPQTLRVSVTGAPAIVSTVRGAVETAVQTELDSVPYARWTWHKGVVPSLTTGKSITIPIRVYATAPDSFPASGIVNVVVKNEAISPITDAELWYSNDPENVRRAGPLFSAPLRLGTSVRLLYHHINQSSTALFIRVQAINDSDKPARVVVIPGNSKPDKDPVRAGVLAADQFVRSWLYSSGEVLTIPPHCTLPVALRRLAPGETLSGLTSLRLIDGPGDIQVRTDAWPPFPTDDRWTAALSASTPWRIVGTRPINDYDRAPSETSAHIYPKPYKEESVKYAVGGRYGFVRIGQKPISRQDNDGSLDGNFGVIYNIKARAENPTTSATDVEVVFEASAGYSGGLFVVNGRYVQTPYLNPKQETQLTRFRLAPGASQTLDITTLPISGCSYPATLTVRPVQVDLAPTRRVLRR